MGTEIKNVGIIGLGRMGRCLCEGWLKAELFKKHQIFFTTRTKESSKKVEEELGIKCVASNIALMKKCDVVILAVKPQNISSLIEEIDYESHSGQLIISIIASVPTTDIENKIKKAAVIRAMPNTPAFVGAGITALCKGQEATEKDLKKATDLFLPLGRVVTVEERLMNAVTGLSGCGPAYVYVILESLTEAGIKVGIPRHLASELSAQTVLGAAKMLLETGKHPAALKDEVTTPAGCTIDGLSELEEGKLRITLIKAVTQATLRAKELAGTKY